MTTVALSGVTTTVLLGYGSSDRRPGHEGWGGGLLPIAFFGKEGPRRHAVLFPLQKGNEPSDAVLVTPEADDFLGSALDWDGELDDTVAARYGELVSAAVRPIDDVRGTADYRRHAVGVLARRTLRWAWDDYRRAAA